MERPIWIKLWLSFLASRRCDILSAAVHFIQRGSVELVVIFLSIASSQFSSYLL